MKQHLSSQELSVLVEGNSIGPKRRKIVRHLAHCPECLADLLAVHRGLATIAALPPPTYYHVLEEGLSWLQAIIPLPLWILNFLLLALFHVLLALVCDLSALWHRRSAFFLFLDSLPVIWFSTWLFVYWDDLRHLSRRLARTLPSSPDVNRFLERNIAICFGWWQLRLPKGLQLTITPFISTLLVILADKLFFWIALPPIGPQKWKVDILFFYVGFVNSAVFWTGLISLWLLFRLAQILTLKKKVNRIWALKEAVDRIVYRFVTISGVGLTMWAVVTYVKQGWAPGHGELFSILLILLLVTYSYFRWRVFGLEQPLISRFRPRWMVIGAWLAALGPILGLLAVEML